MGKNKKNYLYNISYQLFALFVPLITTPYISRTLSVEGIGTYSYTYSMMRYFWLLMALGTATYGTRLIGVCYKSKKDRSENFWGLFILKFILFMIFGFCYIIYSLCFANSKIIALIQGIYLIGVLLDITWFFQGMEDFGKVAFKNFIVKVLNVIFIFIFIKNEDDLIFYILGLAVFQLIGNASMWLSLKKYLIKVNIRDVKPFKHLNESIQLFLPSIATQIFSVLDKSMIGWITKDNLENGYYEQALKIVEMALVLVTTLGTVMIPSISRAFSERERKKVKTYIDRSVKFTFFLSLPMMFGLVGISDKFVPIFFGEEYYPSAIILKILSILFVFMGLNSVFGTQYLISINKQNTLTKMMLIGGFINIIGNFIFIYFFGAAGAAIGTVLGEFATVLIEIIYLKKTNQYSLKNSKINFIKYLISSLIMFIFLIFFSKYIKNIIELLLCIGVASFIYLIFTILLKDEFIIDELKNIKQKLVEKCYLK